MLQSCLSSEPKDQFTTGATVPFDEIEKIDTLRPFCEFSEIQFSVSQTRRCTFPASASMRSKVRNSRCRNFCQGRKLNFSKKSDLLVELLTTGSKEPASKPAWHLSFGGLWVVRIWSIVSWLIVFYLHINEVWPRPFVLTTSCQTAEKIFSHCH